MPKFKIGDCCRFKSKEIIVSDIESLQVKLKTGKLFGKITGVLDCGPEIYYNVDVKVEHMTWNIKVKEEDLTSMSEYVDEMVKDFQKDIDDMIVRERLCKPFDFFKGFGSGFDYVNLGKDLTDTAKALKEKRQDWVRTYHNGIDPLTGERVSDKKMTKSRCIKLLESYRAEREKVRKGRKFERCLRDSVVDEALECAIELLKSEK